MPVTFSTSWLLTAALLGAGDEPRQPPKAPAKPAGVSGSSCPSAGKMSRVVYAVADLVVPINPAPGADQATSAKPAPAACPTSEDGARQARCESGVPVKTTEAQLMALIRGTVEPGSWSDHGGVGTMEYHALGMGLVVSQTQEVQEQVAELLAALRRLQDLEVAVEIRLLQVSEAFLERLGTDCEVRSPNGAPADGEPSHSAGKASAGAALAKLSGLAFLNDLQVQQLLEAAQADRRTNVMQAPRVTVFNGQKANVHVTEQHYYVTGLDTVRKDGQVVVVPKNQAFTTGIRFAVQPAVSADRRFVLLRFQGDLTELESSAVPLFPVTTHLTCQPGPQGRERTVRVQQFVQQPAFRTMKVDKSFAVADGKTAVLRWGTRSVESRAETAAGAPVLSKVPYANRLFRTVGYGRETQTLLLLITPRIIVNEEEEQVFFGELPPIPRE